MKSISRLFNTWPKRVAVAAVAAFAAIALPFASSGAANAVKLESSLGVANVTAGDTQYKQSVNATYDQVVKLQVYYHNTELPESGKVAENLKVNINVPTAAGTTQRVTSTVSADNANSVTSTATINLNRADAYLQYIPGSAVWKHNVGGRAAAEQQIKEDIVSDNVVLSSGGLVLENQKPCYEYAATLTVLVRVMVPGVSIDKTVRVAGTKDWSTSSTAKPGDTLDYQIAYKNTGNTVQKNVIIGDNLPPKLTLVPGSTYLANATNPSGVKYNSDNITSGGINIGNYGAGANAYIKFQVKVPAEKDLECGTTEFRNVGVVRPEGMNEYYNTAITKVTKDCKPVPPTPEKPVYKCEGLTVKQFDGRKITATVKYIAQNGATFKSATYNFGDGRAPLTTDKTTVEYTYAADGTYKITTSLLFSVNGVNQKVTDDKCVAQVTFTTPPVTPPVTPPTPEVPGELPATGAGSVIASIFGISLVAMIAHRLFLSRRLSR